MHLTDNGEISSPSKKNSDTLRKYIPFGIGIFRGVSLFLRFNIARMSFCPNGTDLAVYNPFAALYICKGVPFVMILQLNITVDTVLFFANTLLFIAYGFDWLFRCYFINRDEACYSRHANTDSQ